MISPADPDVARVPMLMESFREVLLFQPMLMDRSSLASASVPIATASRAPPSACAGSAAFVFAREPIAIDRSALASFLAPIAMASMPGD
jgi:hypothetical protein